MSATLRDQRFRKFVWKSARSSLGGEASAFREMVARASLLREFYEPFVDMSPGIVGVEDCESLFTHLRRKDTVAEKYMVRHFLGIQRSLESGELKNGYWHPGTQSLADGSTKGQSYMVTLLRLLESGTFCPEELRPLRGAPSREGGRA